MITTLSANVDKFGKFHSCDRTTYKKIRKVRFFRHVERMQQARHDRWGRKLPHNRVRWEKIAVGTWKSTPWEEPELCPINLNILDGEFRNAKVAHDNPQKVMAMKLDLTGLDAMISRLYAWSDRCYGKRS